MLRLLNNLNHAENKRHYIMQQFLNLRFQTNTQTVIMALALTTQILYNLYLNNK